MQERQPEPARVIDYTGVGKKLRQELPDGRWCRGIGGARVGEEDAHRGGVGGRLGGVVLCVHNLWILSMLSVGVKQYLVGLYKRFMSL